MPLRSQLPHLAMATLSFIAMVAPDAAWAS